MKIIINATDVHSGGGKVMLSDLLSAAIEKDNAEFHVFTDPRYNRQNYSASNINFHKVSKLKRIFVDRTIREIVDTDSVVINISDMPPFKRQNCTVIQFLMNRYFIDNYSMKGLPFIVKARLSFEKWAFRIYLKNADYYFVQNFVMRDLLLKLGFKDKSIKVIPYKNMDPVQIMDEETVLDSFLYVASGEPHKNHRNLIEAWKILAEDGIKPILFLTIDRETDLYYKVLEFNKIYGLKIRIKAKLPRNELLSYYQKVKALIYPSYFECFGIPLIEAHNFNLPIIAAELDYVRDMVHPVETFDPKSPRSIARAVKRFLGNQEPSLQVISANQFIDELITYTKIL